jgi:hypothetical protein
MKKLILLNIFLLLSFSLFTVTIFAHDGHAVPKPKNLDDFLASFKPLGWNIGKTQIISKKVGDNLHVLFGTGGNIAVSIGDDGVLIVDDQFPALMPKIKSAIGKLGGKGLK